MKVLACLLLAAVCTAQMAMEAAVPAGPPVLTQAQLGTSFYGQGLNNPIAIPPPPFVLQRAQQLAATRPDVRVRVNADGTVELTDIYGHEYEDPLGFEVSLDVEELQEQALLAQEQAQEQALLAQAQALLAQQAQIQQRR